MGRRRVYPEHWTTTDQLRYKRFGVSPEQVAERVQAQGGCAVCRVPAPRGLNVWHLDHDHATGRVRGVLCHTCNIAVGMLHDDPERARAAADYLDNHRALESLM